MQYDELQLHPGSRLADVGIQNCEALSHSFQKRAYPLRRHLISKVFEDALHASTKNIIPVDHRHTPDNLYNAKNATSVHNATIRLLAMYCSGTGIIKSFK